MLSLDSFVLRLADGYSVLFCAFMITDSLGSARSLRSLRAESLIVVHDAQAKDEGFAIGCYVLMHKVQGNKNVYVSVYGIGA